MRVSRSFAFVDLCGFTRFTDAHGDEEAVAILTQFRASVREVASEYGVRVAKWLGAGERRPRPAQARLGGGPSRRHTLGARFRAAGRGVPRLAPGHRRAALVACRA